MIQPTKEQLIEAANRLLNCFENLDRWLKLSVAISKKTWYIGSVDDTTRDAIRRLGKLTVTIFPQRYFVAFLSKSMPLTPLSKTEILILSLFLILKKGNQNNLT
jgi:hypothetical protein